MTKWTEDNTENFTAEELATLNEVQDAVEAAHPGIDGQNVADLLNNAWYSGISAADLKAAVEARL